MKVLIADDEPYARKQLLYLLQQTPELECIGEARNGLEAVEMIELWQPDVVFLDIHMPGLNGFDVLHQLRLDQLPLVVFVTAFDAFAIKAFEVEALDYVVKPVSDKRFRQVVRRLLESGRPSLPFQEKDLQRFSIVFAEPLSRIPVRIGRKIKLLTFAEVFWLALESETISAKTADGVYPTHFESLKELENRLPETEFYRINRTILVNLNQIEELIPFGNSQLRITLKGLISEDLKVSRERTRKLKTMLGLSGR